MAKLLDANGNALPTRITLVAGSRLTIKVLGKGKDNKHVILKSSLNSVAVNGTPKEAFAEQKLVLKPADDIEKSEQGKITAYLATTPDKTDNSLQPVNITVLPKLTLPSQQDAKGQLDATVALLNVLLAENVAPEEPEFVASESVQAMQFLRHALVNRLKFPTEFFAPNGTRSLIDIIKARGQVDGFGAYPLIATQQQDHINGILKTANTSGHPRLLECRQHIASAMEVAAGKNLGTDPAPRGLFGWKTAGATEPGPNFEKFRRLSGQDFYTLTESHYKKLTQAGKAPVIAPSKPPASAPPVRKGGP